MTHWHLLLYVGAAILALRSFVKLCQSYRGEYEQQLITEELAHMQTLKQQAEAAEADAETEVVSH